jgi:hypothetical protein
LAQPIRKVADGEFVWRLPNGLRLSCGLRRPQTR